MLRLGPLLLVAISGAVVLAADAARAQTSEPALAAPAAQDDARKATRRRAGDPDVPLYGNPPAFGAGVSGFDSTGALRRKTRAARKARKPDIAATAPRALAPSVTNPPPAAMILPARLSRRGAPVRETISGFNVPATMLMPRRLPRALEDPFAPVGVKAGAFLLRPAIEFTAGHDSNPAHTQANRASSFVVVAPELQVRSDWQRHALDADLRGSYSAFNNHFDPDAPQILDRPNIDSKVRGRLDVNSLSRIDLEGRFLLSTDNPGSPDLQNGLRRFSLVTTVGSTVGYAHRFNRVEIAVKGSIDRSAYQPSTLVNGVVTSNADRDYDQYAGAMRASYDLLPGVKPFVEAGADTRLHDLPLDRTGSERDSHGQYAKAGSTFDFMRSLTGEFSAGYLLREYKDPTLPDLGGITADASLIWTATPLTIVTLTARSSADETIVAGVSGTFRRDFGLQVDHAFRRWLIGTVKVTYGIDDYIGSDRLDHRHSVSAGLLYKANRNLYFKGEIRRDWLRSTVDGADWNANTVLVGVRLQR